MLNRRRFLQAISAAAATPLLGCSNDLAPLARRPLQADPRGLIDLPPGFSYNVISTIGERMADGLPVPGSHDGMAAFSGQDGRVVLIRNHELSPRSVDAGPYGDTVGRLSEEMKSRFYDRGRELSPGLGGTTTTIYNPASGETERQFLSLGGTDINCAGGKTPWGSWLSCEESFGSPGEGRSNQNTSIAREQRHGYVFEVPSTATELVTAVPLKDMGRFEHEAAAVHEASGVIYLTEDRWHSLFYRFLPNVPGQLLEGGRLQALAIADKPSMKTHNWDNADVVSDQAMIARWIDLANVDGDENDLRMRGAADGATSFARGEGITVAGDCIAFACTIGGPARLGQVFSYKPSPYEGSTRESEAPATLTLIAEATTSSLLQNCDNLTMAPWGDLIVCEDTADGTNHCALIGIRSDGSQYMVANNSYSDSELAGVCFSPDGTTLFVNIQYPGVTVAITGPWPS